ncbi:sulfotransferase family protein [uncultured Tateyamaria sp.]|uniref:sulfotransferase family protein n=1 Tax=uncultured Tateyamaria sp. TaxID=455651 RepID=UPI002628B147|nr:sulfotransferase family protein [uncultured Tateyamaria sp.]
MPKTLFIHIGHYKTGTTALQIFFERSARLLKKSGFEYPDIWKHNSKHSAFAFSILRAAGVEKIMFDYRDPTPPRAMWGNLFDHIRASRCQNTLISSEEFMRIGQFPKATEILQTVMSERPSDLTVKAIVYLRDPGSHVASWHNQLIKMNFPVADLSAALDGDIEDIHYDYRRALEPWMTVLGRENVIIRPYIRDLDRPAALHHDLCQSVGIAAAEGDIQIERDPNPRFDDRVIELVRLMQNMKFPRATINAIRNQAVTYLNAQDAVRYGGDDGVGKARAQAQEALDWLSDLPDCALPLDAFAASLPTAPDPQNVNSDLLLGFVLSELIQLRQRVNNYNISELETRLAALEAKLGGKDQSPS